MRTSVAVMMALLGLCGAGLSARPAVRADPGFDPAAARQRMVLPTTKVMVLGLSHLDRAPKAFDPAWLEPVLCRLRAYAPDVILTEAMSGEQLAGIAAYRAVRGNADKWAGSTGAVAKSAQQALAIGPADALATANMLSARPDPAPADRRRLAALFLAAGEPFSAATQWLQLPPTERIAGDGVTAAMKTAIEQFGAARSELASLAVALAVQLKRPRVYSAGDHLSDAALPDDAAFDAALKANPAIIDGLNKATAELAPFSSKALSIDTPDRVLPAFRALNSARFGQLDAQAQWLSLQQSPTMGAVGRQRVAAWEAQNLRMATTIREVTAPIPGGKALLVVGAAHKPFIEAYLRTMTDIEILSVPAMLDATPAGCR